MSDLKQNIDKVLSERAKVSDIVLSRFKEINNLTDKIQVIKQQITIGKITEFKKFVADLEETKALLEKISIDFQFLKERISRTDAVYVGLAGGSRAGKSTFIQALTGLPSEIIPDADETSFGPTTAVHSEIHNSPITEVRITLRTPDEFGKLLKELGFENYTGLDSFKEFDLNEVTNISGDKLKKLKNIQEALPYFEKFFFDPKPIILKESDFSSGKYYFTYMDKDGDSAQNRFWPIVKEAKIYAPFKGTVAEDVPIVLLDLPGFDESTDVSEATIEKLKTVDFTLLIENTSHGHSHLVENFWKNYDKITKGILLKDTFNYYISFLLNRWEQEPGEEKRCNGLKEQLKNRTPHNVSALAIKLGGQLNIDGVKEFFSIQAETLGETLPKMDAELFAQLNQQINAIDLKEKLEKLLSIAQRESENKRQSAEDSKLADAMRKSLSTAYKKLLKDIFDKREDNQNEFKNKLKDIKQSVNETIDATLFYKDKESWIIYADEEASAYGPAKFRQSECHRLWVEIVSKYDEELSNYFDAKLKKFKFDILSIFKNQTKNFIHGNTISVDTVDSAIQELLQRLEDNGLKFDENNRIQKTDIYKAFEFLSSLKLDFRQTIYPYFFKNEVDEYLNPDPAGTPLKLRGEQDGRAKFRESDGSTESSMQQLINSSVEANSKIFETIRDCNTFEYYLLSSLQTFEEWLIRSSANLTDFINFINYFRSELYPEINGSDSKFKKMRQLSKSLDDAITMLNNLM